MNLIRKSGVKFFMLFALALLAASCNQKQVFKNEPKPIVENQIITSSTPEMLESPTTTSTDSQIESLKKEIQDLKKQNADKPVENKQAVSPPVSPVITSTQTTQQPVQQQQADPALKITKCQADTRALVDAYINKAYKMADDAILPRIAEFEKQIKELQIAQINASMTPGIGAGLSPSSTLAAIKSVSHQYDSAIEYDKAAISDYKLKLQQAKDEAKRLYEQQYNNLYAKCLSN